MAKDPTSTTVLRSRAAKEVNRRFGSLRRAVIRTVLRKETGLITNATTDADGRFVFLRDAKKVEEFNAYLGELVEEEILRIEGGGEVKDHWLNKHVGDGYRRGAAKTRLAAERAIPLLEALPDYAPLANPFHAERAELIFTRVYSDLKGVTEVMSTQMSRELANGIINGHNPKKVARAMADRVDKIGRTRSRLIARTEIVESHNSASINESRVLEAETGVEVMMEWITALDGRERPSHRARHQNVYTKDEAQSLIGEPNCRCSVSPVFDISKI